MRESLAVALNSKNLVTKFNDCHLDKIHALGIAAIENPIGVDAIRFVDAMHIKSYKPLIYKLAKESKKSFKSSNDIAVKICEQVVLEYAFSFCKSCEGRAQIISDEKVLQCHCCKGSGLQKYTDTERALAIGVPVESYHKAWAKKFQNVQQIFTTSYVNALKTTHQITKMY